MFQNQILADLVTTLTSSLILCKNLYTIAVQVEKY